MLNMDQEKNNVVDLRNVSPAEHTEAPHRIEWNTVEYEHHEKEFQWFLTAGIVAFGIILSLIILKNIFGAATITLFSIIFYIYATRKPEPITVAIDGRGITVNNKFVPYSSITSFWVLYEPPIKDLIIIRKEHFVPKMMFPLGDANPVEIRSVLLANAIKEKEEEESLTDILSRRIGF